MDITKTLKLLPEGNHRLVCPTCNGGSTRERCMSINIDGGAVQWYCFRAGCGEKGYTLLSGVPIKRKEKTEGKLAVDKDVAGYTRMPVHDNDGELRGWVHRAISAKRTPKTLNNIDEDYIKLHFPSRHTRGGVLLVEDMKSANKMNRYYPSIALLGTHLSEEKVEYMLHQGIEYGIIALDNDATVQAIHIYNNNSFVIGILPLKRDLKDERTVELMRIATELEVIYD